MIQRLLNSIKIIIVVGCLCLTGALVNDDTGPPPVRDPMALLEWTTRGIAAALQAGLLLAQTRPGVAGMGLVFLTGWVHFRAFGRLGRSRAALDPRRMFTTRERRIGFARAGDRCEFDGWIVLTRCRRPARHADHWLPWSRGGASNMANLVAACAWHNTSKGATIPTSGMGARLAWRRRRYFPTHDHMAPGERYRGSL